MHSRVMCLLGIGETSLKDLFFYVLSPVSMSMLTVAGEGRFPKTKAALKNKLKIEVSTRNAAVDINIVDGCATWYHIR